MIIAVEYNDITSNIIHSFKYTYVTSLTSYITETIVKKLKPYMSKFKTKVVFVPVPLHKRRQLERGFNQSELIAKEISRKLGIQVVNLLKRVRYTTPQATLDRKTRLKNLVEAFRIDIEKKVKPGTTFIIVDDVVTTGATITACATILKHYFPFSPIWGLAYARRR